MSTHDHRPTTIFMMLELSGTAFLLTVIVLCVYFRRLFSKKSLNGCTVLITNGGSDLSLSLANQLSCVHKCKIILVKEPSLSNNNETQRTECLQTSSISTFECSILTSAQLDELSKTVDKLYHGIDLIIDNGLSPSAQSPHQNAHEFITSTSNKLRATINLLMFFVPKMKYSLSGHVVSIQSASSGTPRPLLDTRGEIQRVVQLLATNDASINETESPATHSVNVQLTTVLCDPSVERPSPNSKGNNMTAANVAEQIIGGIQRERTLIQITESKSLIQSIFNFFPKIN